MIDIKTYFNVAAASKKKMMEASVRVAIRNIMDVLMLLMSGPVRQCSKGFYNRDPECSTFS